MFKFPFRRPSLFLLALIPAAAQAAPLNCETWADAMIQFNGDASHTSTEVENFMIGRSKDPAWRKSHCEPEIQRQVDAAESALPPRDGAFAKQKDEVLAARASICELSEALLVDDASIEANFRAIEEKYARVDRIVGDWDAQLASYGDTQKCWKVFGEKKAKAEREDARHFRHLSHRLRHLVTREKTSYQRSYTMAQMALNQCIAKQPQASDREKFKALADSIETSLKKSCDTCATVSGAK